MSSSGWPWSICVARARARRGEISLARCGYAVAGWNAHALICKRRAGAHDAIWVDIEIVRRATRHAVRRWQGEGAAGDGALGSHKAIRVVERQSLQARACRPWRLDDDSR